MEREVEVMEPCEEMIRAWMAFQMAEDDENLGLKIEARRKLNELARLFLEREEERR